MVDYSLICDYKKDIVHAGRKGMKRGYHLFGDRDYTPVGTKAEAVERGAEKGRQASSMESWDLKDQVDRMKLESDYRKYSMEEETLDHDVKAKIVEAKEEKVRQALEDAALVLGLIKTTTAIGKDIHGGFESMRDNRNKRKAIRTMQGRASTLGSHLDNLQNAQPFLTP